MKAFGSQGENAIDVAASEWLARCDRTLSAAEEEAFLDWLSSDARHATALLNLARCWAQLDRLRQHTPLEFPDRQAPG